MENGWWKCWSSCWITPANLPPAGGEILIHVNRHSASHLQVTVADTGRGIEPNRLNAVFDRFYQEEGALRRTTGVRGWGWPCVGKLWKG